jgi:hypothetical protein
MPSPLRLITLSSVAALLLRESTLCYTLRSTPHGWECATLGDQPSPPNDITNLAGFLEALEVTEGSTPLDEWHAATFPAKDAPEPNIATTLAYTSELVGTRDRLYVENIRSTLKCNYAEALSFCNKAIAQGYLTEHISYEHPTKGISICTYPKGVEVAQDLWDSHLADCSIFCEEDFTTPIDKARRIPLFAITDKLT